MDAARITRLWQVTAAGVLGLVLTGLGWGVTRSDAATRRESVVSEASIDDSGSGECVAEPEPSAPSGDQDLTESYISRVYLLLFDRGVDPDGLAYWVTSLDSGTPRVAVANFITYSTEYRNSLVTSIYDKYLGRGPDAGGLAYWVSAMQGGLTITSLESGFLTSDEAFAVAGGTNQAWVTSMYRAVLGRDAGPAEVTYWAGLLDHGATRPAVAQGFLLSDEHLTSVVRQQYAHLGLTDSDTTVWVRQLQAGTRFESVIGSLIASDEFYQAG